MITYRLGRHLDQTIYRQSGPDPSDEDELLAFGASPERAAEVVALLNSSAVLERRALMGVPVSAEHLKVDDLRAVLARTAHALEAVLVEAEKYRIYELPEEMVRDVRQVLDEAKTAGR
ncbi:MAG TPA: hypothetical protein VK453_25665 [Micromonosporaceae bacterium]|nr:hypothetical protein [Micromonosporaceae bacterium]